MKRFRAQRVTLCCGCPNERPSDEDNGNDNLTFLNIYRRNAMIRATCLWFTLALLASVCAAQPLPLQPLAPEMLGLRTTPEGSKIRVEGSGFQLLLPMATDWEYYPPSDKEVLLDCRSNYLKMYVTLGSYEYHGTAEQYFEGSFGPTLREDSAGRQIIKDRRFLARGNPVVFAARSAGTKPSKPFWTTVREDREGRILMFTVSALETLHPTKAEIGAMEKYVVEIMTPSLIGVAQTVTARSANEIPIPDTPLTIIVDLPGFVVSKTGVGKHGGDIERLFFAVREETHFSITIQRNLKERTAKGFRDLYWSEVQRLSRTLPTGMSQIKDVKMTDTEKMAILEYTQTTPMTIKFFESFIVQDDIGIKISISKRNFLSSDEQELQQIINSLQIKRK